MLGFFAYIFAYRVNWMEIMGTTYKPTISVIIDYYQDLPIFGEIQDVVSVDKKFYLATHLLKTTAYNPHFHAYEVKKTSNWFVCEISSLRDYHPLWVYQSYDVQLIQTFFVPLKYHVMNNVDLQL